MTVINGLPAHALFVHFLVALVPLTALLEIVCALWPVARRGHLVWLTLSLAVVTTALTTLTTDTGEWLYGLRRDPSPILREHAQRGDTLIYFSVALLIVAVVVVALRWAEQRADRRRRVGHVVVAVIALVVGIGSIVQVYRIGDAGAQSVWGNEIADVKGASGT